MRSSLGERPLAATLVIGRPAAIHPGRPPSQAPVRSRSRPTSRTLVSAYDVREMMWSGIGTVRSRRSLRAPPSNRPRQARVGSTSPRRRRVGLHRRRRRTDPSGLVSAPVLEAGHGQWRGRRPAHARPSPHGRLVVDRPRRLGEAGPGVGGSSVGRHRVRPLGHLFPGAEDPVMDSLDVAASLPPRWLPRTTREIRAMERRRPSPVGRPETTRPLPRQGSRRCSEWWA